MNKAAAIHLIALMFIQYAFAMDGKRPIAVNDLSSIQDVGGPSISPSGEDVVYVVSVQNSERDAANSDLWKVPFEGGKPVAMTKTPDKNEWASKYSPDGNSIAFLSDNTEKGETQIFLMNGNGGDIRQVSSIEGGVSEFSWAPDSRRIAVTAFVGAAKPNEAGTKPPIVIDRFQFKEDWNDYLASQRLQLFILDTVKKTAIKITEGAQDHWLPAWSPDGKWIAFVSKNRGDADRNMDNDVFITEPKPGAEQRRISTFRGTDVDPYWLSPPAWSPDSKRLVWLQSGESKWIYYAPWQLTIADIESGENRNIARIDRSFYTPKWSGDGRHIYALIEQDRSTWLGKIDSQSGDIEYLNEGARFALEYDVSDNDKIVLLDSNDQRPFELVALGENERQITDHNAWLNEIELGITKPFTFMNDGHEISGIMALPSGYKKGDKLPAIFRLHGGPVYQFSHEFMSDWQIYAASGFVVVGINPRGSSGKGFDFAKAIYADWGNVDVSDILAGSDYLVNEGIVDPARMGVGGWSYGGILTDYVIASDTRFKAAVSGAGAANMFGTYGHDQYSREYELELGTPWENTDQYMRVSYPFFNADKITTPTLFQCAEKDFNVPCLGSEQMYQALRSLGIDTRLVIYPDQHHGITVPSYLDDRMKRNLDWYKKYLMDTTNEVVDE